jgi:hypothetical protein
LNLLRLAGQIDGRDLVAPPSDRRLVGKHRQHHRADRGNAPRTQPPQLAAIELIFLRQKAGEHAAGILGFETAAQMVRILVSSMVSSLGHTKLLALPRPARITTQTLTGNTSPTLNGTVRPAVLPAVRRRSALYPLGESDFHAGQKPSKRAAAPHRPLA